MSTVPVITLPAEQFGLLGITLDPVADNGNGQDAHALPTVTVSAMDERQTCLRVLQFVHYGQLPDLPGCPNYVLPAQPEAVGHCARGNGRTCPAPCLFHEPADHPTWTRAAGWQYDPISGSVIARPLWADFGLQEVER